MAIVEPARTVFELMRRWHAERERMLRRWRLEIHDHERDLGNDGPIGHAPLPPVADATSCHCYRGMGYFRKRHPFDCGRPRCGVCSYGGRRLRNRGRANRLRAAITFELANAA